MTTKHTPGPWKSTKDGRIFSASTTEWNRTLNADMPAWIAATGANPANSALIAAAPDLLAALEAMLDFADSVEQCEAERTGEYDAMPDPRVDQARAAIAKARGE